MPKTRITLKILGLIIVTLLAWVAFQSSPGRPNVSVTFLGYKNDTAGTRLAIIAVTNLSAPTVFVYQPLIEIPDKAERAGVAFDQSHRPLSWHSTLDKGASQNLAIPLPTNQTPWKIRMLVDNNFATGQIIKGIITGQAGRMPYEIESDWIQN